MFCNVSSFILRLSELLTLGTDMRAATSDTDFGDGCVAMRTGLAVAAKYFGEEVEVVAFGAVGFYVVFHGGAAGVDGIGHGFYNSFEDFGGFLRGEGGGSTCGVDLGVEEGFVGVDVADASDGGLVEEDGFDGATGVFLETLVEIGGGEVEWFGTEGLEELFLPYPGV